MLAEIKYIDGMPIDLQICSVQYYPIHHHDDIQIIYVLEGTIDLKLSFSIYKLKKNDLHFIHQNDLHGILNASEDNLLLILSLKSEALIRDFPDLHAQIFTTRITDNVIAYKQKLQLQSNIFTLLSGMFNNDFNHNTYELTKELIDLLYKNFRGYKVNKNTRSFEHVTPYDSVQVERISRIVGYIYDNYAYKISLEGISNNEHLNKYYLSHLFRQLTGENLRDFLSMVRVEMAEHDVLNSDKSISEISTDCGFSKVAYFSSHFRTWYNLTPDQYRQKFKMHSIAVSTPRYRSITYEEIDKHLDSMLDNSIDLHLYSSTCIRICPDDLILYEQDFLKNTRIILNPDSLDSPYLKKQFEDFADKHTGLNCEISNKVPDNTEGESYETNIRFIKEYLDTISLPGFKKVPFFDTDKEQGGLITSDGLVKPALYILEFLLSLYKEIICLRDDLIVTVENGKYQYISFNCSAHAAKTNVIELLSLTEDLIITEHRLIPEDCYTKYLGQLSGKNTISETQRSQINSMTSPRINYKVVNHEEKHTHKLLLAPYEIIYGDIRDI